MNSRVFLGGCAILCVLAPASADAFGRKEGSITVLGESKEPQPRTCQGMSNHFGITMNLPFPACAAQEAREWWSSHGCRTSPQVSRCNCGPCPPTPAPSPIHVFITNYYNLPWLVANVKALRMRATLPLGPSGVQYTIVDMSDNKADFDKVKTTIAGLEGGVGNGVEVHHFTAWSGVGGGVLPQAFKFIATHTRGDITVQADTDAVVLAQGWDQQLVDLYRNSNLVLAAINPRPGFTGQAEWNWSSYRTSFYRSRMPGVHGVAVAGRGEDYGHWFSQQAKSAGKEHFLWNERTEVFKGRSPIIVGTGARPWALHCFYLSRRKNEKKLVKAEAGASLIITPAQESALLKWLVSESPTLKTLAKVGGSSQGFGCYFGAFSMGLGAGGRCVSWKSDKWTEAGCSKNPALTNRADGCVCEVPSCTPKAPIDVPRPPVTPAVAVKAATHLSLPTQHTKASPSSPTAPPAAAAVSTVTYTCHAGACVAASAGVGVPLKTCQSACVAVHFQCVGGKCQPAASGPSKSVCEKLCA